MRATAAEQARQQAPLDGLVDHAAAADVGRRHDRVAVGARRRLDAGEEAAEPPIEEPAVSRAAARRARFLHELADRAQRLADGVALGLPRALDGAGDSGVRE